MFLIPEFQIGLFNAWLLFIPIWLLSWIIFMIAGKDVVKRISDSSWCMSKDKIAGGIPGLKDLEGVLIF